MGSLVATPIAVAFSIISAKPSDIVKFCKWLYAYFYILASRAVTKKRFDLYDKEAHHEPAKLGFLPPQLEVDLESPQPENHLLQSADEVFFYGVNSSRESLVVRLARSVNHEAEAWIYMKLKDGKTYKLHKTSGYQNSCSDVGREFTCGGLRIQYILAMRRWRIFYNGLLRETTEEVPDVGKLVYVKFAFIWCASSDVFDMTTDINSAALALAIAKCKWKSLTVPMKKLQDAFNMYAHSGAIHGTVTIEGESSDRNIYLFGERIRFLGDTLLNGVQFTHVLGQISKTGSIIHIAQATIPGIVKDLSFGFVVLPDSTIVPISDTEMKMEDIVSNGKENIRALFHADGREFKLKGNLAGRMSHFESNTGWDGSLTIDCLDIEMNQHKGSGVLMKGQILNSSSRSSPKITAKETPTKIPPAVHFSEGLCEISEITGGKGSSLGKLSQLSKKHQNFIVPNGIVVTTSAYQSFLNSDIRREIISLEDVLYGKTPGDVKEACQRVMDEVIKSNLPDVVLQAVVKCLQKAFGEEMHSKKFAVRSSATGEDTEQMSAAGQMETYLGIKGLNEIISAVKKCWASQFSFIAVQYKRQNGQMVNSPMAVVIQEMVPCDVAGVLFSCDPLTGNPTLMSITANYGLGESVVSGSEEPDTIELKRNEDDELEIRNKIVGAKAHRIVVKDDEGTSLEEVSENEKNSCCLSDAMALRLGKIAIQIENSYRSNRDIEWGFWNNNLYIFQSRPVTSGTGETDYEIDHEIDAPMWVENEYFTVCNVGEVMPGALSPLGIDVLMKFFNIGLQRKNAIAWQGHVRPTYYHKGVVHMYYHAMFYAVDLMEQINEGRAVAEATMIGMYGRVLDEEDIYDIAKLRFEGLKSAENPIYKKYKLLHILFGATARFEKALKSYSKYHVPTENLKTSEEVFNALIHACDDLSESLNSHCTASMGSSIWNIFIINVIGNARGGISPQVYRDFSRLLISISGVESADVPSAMQSLAYEIGKEIDPEEIKKMDCEDILKWLETTSTQAGIKFREFLEKHGHRCLKEFDIRQTTWGEDPKLLIQLLQNLVGSVSQDSSSKEVEDFDHMLKDLDLNLKWSAKLLLKYLLLPQCRKAVQLRERTKSLMVKLVDDWRKGYRHLAKLMVSEGRIPEEDILYFMSVEEIAEFLKNRSPKILSKAIHRQRRHPVLDKYIFPEISKGFPKPVNVDSTPIITADDFKMQGIPVSQGVATGYVRVALSLEEASHLKKGEILLTYSTDIGWTPYFPSLAGVVTELGGLISHGAVVSREYGLPCIAGLHGATRQFQTGDYVLLDGNRGILQKLTRP